MRKSGHFQTGLCQEFWSQFFPGNNAKLTTGCGVSVGDEFTVTFTIGQPDDGTLTGDGFVLTGGFWGCIAAPDTQLQSPSLTVKAVSNNTLSISWSSVPWPAASNWFLEIPPALGGNTIRLTLNFRVEALLRGACFVRHGYPRSLRSALCPDVLALRPGPERHLR